MGIPKPKRLPHGGIDRTHVKQVRLNVKTRRVEADLMCACLIVKIKPGDKAKQAFREFIRRNGVHTLWTDGEVTHFADKGKTLVPVGKDVERRSDKDGNEYFAETAVIYQCAGTDDDLSALLWQPFVLDWEYATNTRVGQIAAGGGSSDAVAAIRRRAASAVRQRYEDDVNGRVAQERPEPLRPMSVSGTLTSAKEHKVAARGSLGDVPRDSTESVLTYTYAKMQEIRESRVR